MNIFKSAWNALDGKKVVLGYFPTQMLGDQNVVSALVNAADAWAIAIGTHKYSDVVRPTIYALAQVMLLVGVSHKIAKEVKASDTSSP